MEGDALARGSMKAAVGALGGGLGDEGRDAMGCTPTTNSAELRKSLLGDGERRGLEDDPGVCREDEPDPAPTLLKEAAEFPRDGPC